MYELKKMERNLRVNLLRPGPRLKKKIYRAAVLQRLRNTALEDGSLFIVNTIRNNQYIVWIKCKVLCVKRDGIYTDH